MISGREEGRGQRPRGIRHIVDIALNYITVEVITLHCSSLLYTTFCWLRAYSIAIYYIPLMSYTMICCLTLHSIALHYIHCLTFYSVGYCFKLHSIPIYYALMSYTTLSYFNIQSNYLNYISLYYTPLSCTTLHRFTLHSNTLHLI